MEKVATTVHYYEPPNFRNPFAVGNQVVSYVKNRDLDGLISLCNEANRTVLLSPQQKKYRRELERKLEVAAKRFEKAQVINEFKEMARDDSWGFLALAAGVRQERHLMFTVTLTREGDRYLFDHLGMLHVAEFRRWQDFGRREM
jgi:hypothetical protein